MDVTKILVPTDGSAHAEKALDLALDLAAAKGAAVLLLTVQREHGSDLVPPELENYQAIEHVRITEHDLLRSRADGLLRAAQQAALDRGLPAPSAEVREGDPARVIVETARRQGVDLIVMGSRGRGDLEGLLLGSVSHKVAHAAPCSCLLVR